MRRTQHDLLQQGYRALVQSLGAVDAVRFIQLFSSGEGDYTAERQQMEQPSLDEVLAEIEAASKGDLSGYEEVIE